MKALHVLAQRPSLTGSGVTLEALVRQANLAGIDQAAIVGVPEGDAPQLGGLPPERIHPLSFGGEELPFAVPGMSDVMPYASTRYSSMSEAQLGCYRGAWRTHLAQVIDAFRPEMIHAHHVWLLSAMIKDVAPNVPLAVHSHSTGLRQMKLCPHLAQEVKAGCARAERFYVLHRQNGSELQRALGVDASRVEIVGAGYREELFFFGDDGANRKDRLLYIGKYSAAKGLPWLLEALERLLEKGASVELHVAGTGAGSEADALEAKMRQLAPAVVMHGQVDQQQLATLMRSCAVAVLPSMYEGLPLVLVEAMACGCRLVATALPGVTEQLAPHLGDALHTIAPPRRVNVDQPVPEDLPAFVDELVGAIESALAAPPLADPALTMPEAIAPFTWASVCERVFTSWRALARRAAP